MYGSFASNSPATDGKRVYAFFGSRGLYAYDVDGRPLWQKDFGVQMQMRLQFGEGAAAVLHGDRLIVSVDHEGPGFITMLDAATGREMWKTPRQDGTTWSRPFVAEHGGKQADRRDRDDEGPRLRFRERRSRSGKRPGSA